MAFTYSFVVLVVLCVIFDTNGSTTSTDKNSALDQKKAHNVVDVAFLEQKDVLLNMLETKLKEVRDKKKHKIESEKCDTLPKNIDIRLKANGVSAVGEADVLLKYGKSGNGTLNFTATGISNIGKAQLDLGLGDGNFNMPGLLNLFDGRLKPFCKETAENDNVTEVPEVATSANTDANPSARRLITNDNKDNSNNTKVVTVNKEDRVDDRNDIAGTVTGEQVNVVSGNTDSGVVSTVTAANTTETTVAVNSTT